MIIGAALDHGVQRRLVDRNVAHHNRSRRRPPNGTGARSSTADRAPLLSHRRPLRNERVAAARSNYSLGRTQISSADCPDLVEPDRVIEASQRNNAHVDEPEGLADCQFLHGR